MGFFDKLKEGLKKTKNAITERIDQVLVSFGKIDEELFDELEEILITSDVGTEATLRIIEDLKKKVKENKITDPLKVKELLKDELKELLSIGSTELNVEASPSVIVVVGVNGVGKTTSIGKIANQLKQKGKKVVMAAADTFRAAAIDQLEIWANRVGVELIKHSEGSDPAAVVFDAIQAVKARKSDVLICDTAGRLHNKKNLMDELKKIFRIIDRELPEASKEVLLVLDATTGQNAIVQAKTFKEVSPVSGIVLTKLDGTAKGGIVIAISSELNIPVKLIGVGEKIDDLQRFNADEFVEALFS
ncbi:signal recognition particle-docking protein FtsY [Acetivibrio clariflavus]|uniref:Signal recognition particle receptor FtsY n=1 Tax=Acetivibrio clariflavus (strain DSM 19732 / NBRC 101661 / EBR45) TaxID=720554 RepID=G8M1K2_ACECE|nr:signal recognition particle-docking protein FtsY [Acetivibrio clariflavus]AEV69217.1 signal recognition particle-docking protein FtsY [Acetivibrio clariflavus DSM 19732]HOQ01128.1 signal recognition particle-docking protein FtsY [Acetivibrio clariflavus]HPU41410.1 signal recognition particle-docking protein FtsY [Acetivibrio clariflavus]